MRTLLRLTTLALLSACATSGEVAQLKEQVQQYRLRMGELQQWKDSHIATEAVKEKADDKPLVAYEALELVAYVENRPPFCSGGLCLELHNNRPNPIANIEINGAPVTIHAQSGRGPFLWPGEQAYVVLPWKQRYTIAARTVHAVGLPNGQSFPNPNVVMEQCEWHGMIPLKLDIEIDRAIVHLTGSSCG